MTTKAHPLTMGIAQEWETYYGSAVFSGIVGDLVHQANGGYHISIQDQPSTNYSVVRPDDKAPPGTWPRDYASGIDMSMNSRDMAVCSNRLWDVWNDTTDPRRQYLNGFNGWFNDGGPAKRYDFVTQKISTSTPDHKWHVHLEIRRRYVTSAEAAKAILSILRGETKQQYLDSLIVEVESDDMFCEHGQTNGKVWVLQSEINKVLRFQEVAEGELLTRDGEYGDKTAAGLMRIGVGNPDNNGRIYWAGEYDRLQDLLREIAARTHGVKGDPGEKGDPGKSPTQVSFGPVTATVTAWE